MGARFGPNSRGLWAWVDENGNLRIDAQDLGPAAAMVSPDGEYEWFQKIARADVPPLLELLGADLGDDILDVLKQHWRGEKSYEFERLPRESEIRVDLSVWG